MTLVHYLSNMETELNERGQETTNQTGRISLYETFLNHPNEIGPLIRRRSQASSTSDDEFDEYHGTVGNKAPRRTYGEIIDDLKRHGNLPNDESDSGDRHGGLFAQQGRFFVEICEKVS